jgi:hypothetical protein
MASPQPLKSIRSLIQTYLQNRAEFYRVLLSRIPDAGQRKALEEATSPADAPLELTAAVESLPDGASDDDLLRALGLRDALKKAGFGFAFGRTAISTTDSVQRAQSIEETGVIVFSYLLAGCPSFSDVFQSELRRRRAALIALLLKLEDSLRYHRFLPPHR